MPAVMVDLAEGALASKADRILAMRAQLSDLDPDRAGLFRVLAQSAADEQAVALDALADVIGRKGLGEGFFRESRPRAFLAHQSVRRDTRLPGVFPFGAEAAAVNASAAILFENEAMAAGEHVHRILLAPVVSVLGPEMTWTDHQSH